jgi:hypothetical protein
VKMFAALKQFEDFEAFLDIGCSKVMNLEVSHPDETLVGSFVYFTHEINLTSLLSIYLVSHYRSIGTDRTNYGWMTENYENHAHYQICLSFRRMGRLCYIARAVLKLCVGTHEDEMQKPL